jgi:glutathione S-transferase
MSEMSETYALYFSHASPYARKARIVLRERDLLGLVTEIDTKPLLDPANLRAANPLGKVPALTRPGAPPLFDSPVICAYLDRLGPMAPLLPSEGEAHWRVRRLEALSDGVMDCAVSLRIEDVREQGLRNGEWIARWKRSIANALDVAAQDMQSAPEGFDLGAISLVCALSYLDYRHAALAWRQGRPLLGAWFDQAGTRLSVQDTAPPP